MTYRIELVSPVEETLDTIPDWAFFDVDNAILYLSRFPEMGRVYEPSYPAERIPGELRVTYARNYGIYYTVDHDKRTVYIHFIEDQRMNPLLRFSARRRGRKE